VSVYLVKKGGLTWWFTAFFFTEYNNIFINKGTKTEGIYGKKKEF
jgi:hypothetical protein